jgi:Fe(3+) dicitrate transport protein
MQSKKRHPTISNRLAPLAGVALAFAAASAVNAQPEDREQQSDPSGSGLEEIVVINQRLQRNDIDRLPAIQGTAIFAGKKTEVIGLEAIDANLVQKNAREVFAKVPGVFVYDMDGTGNQVNIATRGLDPHRGWEFNIRMDGFITNSDMYGYPASHFSLPMESVERIELVRGTGALQYGAQFGGLLNYVTKQAGPEQGFGFETINSAASFGTLATYNALSGRFGRSDLYAYYSRRVSDGYRDASETEAEYYGIRFNHELGDTLELTAGYAWSEYRVQLPGPLTDAMFEADPKQATRERNYYSPVIYVPSVGIEWTPNARTTISWTASAIRGARNSVLFDRPADVPDEIQPATLAYANRQVDIDDYDSFTTAVKALQRYDLWGREHALTAGIEYMDNDTHRRQQGVGTTGTGYDLSLVQPGWGRDLHLLSDNVAFFLENRFALTDRLSVSPGFRVESGDSRFEGMIVGYDPAELPNTIGHDFTLFGVSVEYALDADRSVYAGWSEAYRPILFKDIVPSSPLERVDKNLDDGRGHTIEAGYRGETKSFGWDFSVFELRYDNRMGTTANLDGASFYNLRTNIGDSRTRGVEAFLQYRLPLAAGRELIAFTSTSYMNGRYLDAVVRVGQDNIPLNGSDVQSVPAWISRNGMTLRTDRLSATLLLSYTDESFADALNTRTPSANGAVGIVPSYALIDLSAAYQITPTVSLRASINNLADRQYFTKRPEFYPGPGIWSSDGRSVYLSVGLKL